MKNIKSRITIPADNITIEEAHYFSKGEDRISVLICPNIFFEFPEKVRSLIMTRATTSLDSFVRRLEETYWNGSTLSRANIRLQRINDGKVRVQISTCNDGDSPIFLFINNKKIPLFTSHNTLKNKRIGPDNKSSEGLNMTRSIGDQWIKKSNSALTSTPDTLHFETVLGSRDSLSLALMSDGVGYSRKSGDHQHKRYSAVDEFKEFNYFFTARQLVSKAVEKNTNSGHKIDDTTVLQFKVTTPIENSYTCTLGVDDGHGNSVYGDSTRTAELCSKYYTGIQEFWTVVFDNLLEKNKIKREKKTILSFLEDQKQLLKTIEGELITVLVQLEQEESNINSLELIKNKTFSPYFQNNFEFIKVNNVVLRRIISNIESKSDSKETDLKPLSIVNFPKLFSQQITYLLGSEASDKPDELINKIKNQMLVLTSSATAFKGLFKDPIHVNFNSSTLFSVAAVCLLADTSKESKHADKILNLTAQLAYKIMTEDKNKVVKPEESKNSSFDYLTLTTAKRWQTEGCMKMFALFGWQDTISQARNENNLLGQINRTKRNRFDPTGYLGLFRSKIRQWQQATEKMQISLATATDSRIQL